MTFAKAEQFEDESLLGANKVLAKNGKRDYLQEGTSSWNSGNLGIKDNCKIQIEVGLATETAIIVHSHVNEKSIMEEMRP